MAKESSENIVNLIKNRLQNSGSGGSFRKFFNIRSGERKRIRFLTDMDGALQVSEHDKWQELMPTPCYSYYGKDCPYCDDNDYRTRDAFIWSVYSYDDKEVKLFKFSANPNTPIPQMVSHFENYGTLIDRDYVVSRQGDRRETTYTLSPLDKSKFKGEGKYKPISEKDIFKLLAEASNIVDQVSGSGKKAKKKKDEVEDDEDELEDIEDDEEDEDTDDEEEDTDDDDDDDEGEEDGEDEDEEEEEVKPKKKSAKSTKPAAKGKKGKK